MEELSNLAHSLVNAQMTLDREAESKIMPKIIRALGRKFGTNGNDGRSDQQRFFEKIAFGVADCWYWVGCLDGGGYGTTGFGSETRAHRTSWVMFNGSIPNGIKVLHKCDVRNCVNPEHLWLGTQADNVSDMIAKGMAKLPVIRRGEDSHFSKLSWQEVNNIRKEYAGGDVSMKKLAEKHGISTMTVCRAVNFKSWRVKNG